VGVAGSAWVLPVKENERLEAEVKKHAIIRDDLDTEMTMIRDGAAKMVQATDV
jgi:hypothetical protein